MKFHHVKPNAKQIQMLCPCHSEHGPREALDLSPRLVRSCSDLPVESPNAEGAGPRHATGTSLAGEPRIRNKAPWW